MTRKIISTGIAGVLALAAGASQACFPCSYWQTWGQREQVCAAPSEGLLEDALDAWCVTGCALECDAWCASYAACEVSGAASCAPTGATAECDACVEQVPATQACSGDLTGCAASCSEWLGGSPVCETATAEELDLSACACAGPCAAKCAGSCALGYFDTSAQASGACAHCLTKSTNGCGGSYAACQGT